MAAADFGGDGRKTGRQVLDHAVAEVAVEAIDEALAVDKASAGEVEVEVAEYAPSRQVTGEKFEMVELVGGEATADHGPDRCAGNDVRPDTGLLQCPQNADVGPSARGSAAQRQSDLAQCHGRSPAGIPASHPSRVQAEAQLCSALHRSGEKPATMLNQSTAFVLKAR